MLLQGRGETDQPIVTQVFLLCLFFKKKEGHLEAHDIFCPLFSFVKYFPSF